MSALISFTNKGFYCEEGDFYIDPISKVNKALITHGHSDHAIRGHSNYLTQYRNIPILKTRLSSNLNIQGVEYGEILNINGVKVTFFPAGHVVGSSQIKIEKGGDSWVISGDYKIEDDNLATKFVPVKCTNFVTETTFGQPIFKWDKQSQIFQDMNHWINQNRFENIFSVIVCYSLGKAQRILRNVEIDGKIYVHPTIYKMNQAIESSGVILPKYFMLDINNIMPGDLVLAPHTFLKEGILNRNSYAVAEASGWMAIQNPRGIDKRFVLSDHADWNGLNYAVKESGAERIFTTHGFTKTYANWLRKKGYEAFEVDTYNDLGIEGED